MSKLTNIILVLVLVLTAFHFLRQNHAGILRSATAIEKSTTQAPNAQQTQTQLRQLLLERKSTLDEIAEDIERNIGAGRASMAEYAEAKTASLTAGLDLCETKDDRVKIYAEIAKLQKNSEEWTKRRYELGQVGQVDLAKAKVARIESEIDLLREKLR